MNPAPPDADTHADEPAPIGTLVYDPTKGTTGRVIDRYHRHHHPVALLQRPGGRPWEARPETLRPATTHQRHCFAALDRRHVSANRSAGGPRA
ncbi:hypothetical protein [Streptomyces sp. NPDC002490]|uniref:hypothetical protein n=1 Tax=Streptomyces sp. NPDC002490 TaxID=3154416 RepID=UPI003316534B